MIDPFEDLQPPPGGLTRLRAHIERPRRPLWPVGATLLVAATALWLLIPSSDGLRTSDPLVLAMLGEVAGPAVEVSGTTTVGAIAETPQVLFVEVAGRR